MLKDTILALFTAIDPESITYQRDVLVSTLFEKCPEAMDLDLLVEWLLETNLSLVENSVSPVQTLSLDSRDYGNSDDEIEEEQETEDDDDEMEEDEDEEEQNSQDEEGDVIEVFESQMPRQFPQSQGRSDMPRQIPQSQEDTDFLQVMKQLQVCQEFLQMSHAYGPFLLNTELEASRYFNSNLLQYPKISNNFSQVISLECSSSIKLMQQCNYNNYLEFNYMLLSYKYQEASYHRINGKNKSNLRNERARRFHFLYKYPKLVMALLVLDFKILPKIQSYFEEDPLAQLDGYQGASYWSRQNTPNPFCIQIESMSYFNLRN
jgi:hypothetical protein